MKEECAISDKAMNVIDQLYLTDFSTDAIEVAVVRLETLVKTLDSLLAEYDITFDGAIVTVTVDPAVSYNKSVFKIDVMKRSFTKM